MTDTDDVVGALRLVLEEFDRSRDGLKEHAREEVSADHFEEVRSLLATVEQLGELGQRIQSILDEWQSMNIERRIGVAVLEVDSETEAGTRQYLGRVERGLRTPEASFRTPILSALTKLGDSADINDVLDHVGVQLADVLKPVDFEGLQSDTETIRWRNTAQWSRNELVKRGLMEPSRERGVWEISEAGRQWLNNEAHSDD